MGSLVCFVMQCHESNREFWYELTIVRKLGDELKTSFVGPLTYTMATKFADRLAELHGVNNTAGMYAGAIMTPTK